MTIVPIVIFATSLLAIGVLFAIKRWETAHGRVLAPQVRMRADRGALKLKSRLQDVRMDAAKLPPMAALYARYFVHEAALSFAAFARTAERQAHRVADLVSHKRYFVARETRSEFLKKVSEHRQEGGVDSL